MRALSLLVVFALAVVARAGDPNLKHPLAGDRDPTSHKDGDRCEAKSLAGWSNLPDGGTAPLWRVVPGTWRWVKDTHADVPNRSPDDFRTHHPYLWECHTAEGRAR